MRRFGLSTINPLLTEVADVQGGARVCVSFEPDAMQLPYTKCTLKVGGGQCNEKPLLHKPLTIQHKYLCTGPWRNVSMTFPQDVWDEMGSSFPESVVHACMVHRLCRSVTERSCQTSENKQCDLKRDELEIGLDLAS